ncbi:MAG: hypothetical protein NVSMB47_22670 [Polyangiales bacterium]
MLTSAATASNQCRRDTRFGRHGRLSRALGSSINDDGGSGVDGGAGGDGGGLTDDGGVAVLARVA